MKHILISLALLAINFSTMSTAMGTNTDCSVPGAAPNCAAVPYFAMWKPNYAGYFAFRGYSNRNNYYQWAGYRSVEGVQFSRKLFENFGTSSYVEGRIVNGGGTGSDKFNLDVIGAGSFPFSLDRNEITASQSVSGESILDPGIAFRSSSITVTGYRPTYYMELNPTTNKVGREVIISVVTSSPSQRKAVVTKIKAALIQDNLNLGEIFISALGDPKRKISSKFTIRITERTTTSSTDSIIFQEAKGEIELIEGTLLVLPSSSNTW